MGYITLRIIDEKDKRVEIYDLTEIGRCLITTQAMQLISDLEDIDREEKE